jgi:DNA-binding transcriptional LysR family regulator
LVRRVLFREGYRCFVRADHPALADGGLSLERYLALPHAMVSPSGERPGLVDAALAELGHTRRVALRLPHFGAAPAFLAHSDLVLTAPAALARVVDASIAVVAPRSPYPSTRSPSSGTSATPKTPATAGFAT